jgi:hypothetical protein
MLAFCVLPMMIAAVSPYTRIVVVDPNTIRWRLPQLKRKKYPQNRKPMSHDAEVHAKEVHDEDEPDFELITSARMLAPPPALRKETVTLDEWRTKSGRAAAFLVWELTAAEFSACIESGWTYTREGARKKYDDEAADVRFLAYVLRDQNGHRLWPKIEDAKTQLGLLGRSTIQTLVAAGNRMNSAREAAKAGNSETTQSDS